MIREPFAQGDSPLHHLDPRCRILSAVSLCVVTASAGGLKPATVALALGAAFSLVARLPLATLFRRLAAANLFLVFLWVVLPLTWPRQAAGLVNVQEPLAHALLITVKANAVLLLFWSLVGTMPIVTLGHALGRIMVPWKFAHLLLLTYRYLHVIEAEFGRLWAAATLRGFRPGMNRMALRAYASLVGTLLLRSAARGRRVHEAMICRGFAGRLYSLHRFAVTRRDAAAMAVFAVALFLIVFSGEGWQWGL